MPTRRRMIALAAAPALLASGVAATPAQAAALQTVPCYIYDSAAAQNVPMIGTGFTPGGLVRLSYVSKNGKESSAGSATADPAGNFAHQGFPALFNSFKTTDQTYVLRATDLTNPELLAEAPYRQARGGVDFQPNSVKDARRKVRYTARGFTAGSKVYAHFRYRSQTRANVLLGTATGPCGIVTRRIRLVPQVRTGEWQVAVDMSKVYRRTTRPQARISVRIFRRFL